ncbi:MAG: hypothetical protein ACTTK1_04580, partial [Candidatus Cryptobacteroides sp.]
TQGGNTEDRILYLEKKQTTPFTPAEQLEFEPYKKYDINVGVGNKWIYHLEATDISAPYSGGFISGWVRSYKTDGGPTNPASWWVDGYSETGPTGPFTATKPAWLTSFTPNGNGVSNPTASEPVTANVSAQTPTITLNPRTTALQGKSEVGSSADPIDLSRVPAGTSPFFSIANGASASTYASNPMNTANCYVVTRPGWYKIPMVYGNAFKNGSPNTEAYNPSVSYPNNFLKPFIRHDGNAITNPWIRDNSGINLNTGVAELLWQDQKDLVQSIQLQPDKKYIVFHIDKATIHEGNAVIALKESATGDIVWSWHVWVYGGDDLKSINVKNNKAKSGKTKGRDNFDFLSENLGSCYDSGESITYSESNVWVKISNRRKTDVIKIFRSTDFTIPLEYNSPYYQWGRKDPILPSNGTNSSQNKFWYDKVGTRIKNFLTANWLSGGGVTQAKAEIANTIKNPQTFNTSHYMDNLYLNLWDTNCNETSGTSITAARFLPVTKSVYDPCPPGFCLPPNGAFTGFTDSGQTSWNSSEWNVSGNFDKGWHFRTVLMGEPDAAIDPTIFFPALGYRSNDNGFLNFVSFYSFYWSSTPYNIKEGCYLYFHHNVVSSLNYNVRSNGYVVRPVAEN